jgi:hypothetical protein
VVLELAARENTVAGTLVMELVYLWVSQHCQATTRGSMSDSEGSGCLKKRILAERLLGFSAG